MELHLIKTPFPHVIIDNFYTGEELFHIWKEIDFLSYSHKLEKPLQTGSALFEDGTAMKQNYALHLDNLYKNRNISNILQYNRKLFQKDITDSVSEYDFSFLNFKSVNHDFSLLSYYENGGHYKSHKDISCFTALTWLYKSPKSFDGGDIYFEEYDHKVTVQNNRLLLFNSAVLHQVTDVAMKSVYETDKSGHFSCMGRYTISQFLAHDYTTEAANE